jgi:inositol oxygenase
MGHPQTSKSSPKANRKAEEFRNYKDSARQDRVSQFYFLNHKYQTLEFAKKQKERFSKGEGREMSCWDAVLLLNELVDDSDPDTEQAQIIHLLQAGESLRNAWPGPEYDWLHLAGFIHDLGKVLAHPTFYNEPQWAVVGDTFPLGCQFDKSIVFHEYFSNNPDIHVPEYNTKFGIYHEGIGLDNVTMSWGHDEYFYQVCKLNNCTLPPAALNIIRYHSFYAWHSGGGYTHLMNEEDKKMLPWVKEFQKHDLYSKLPEKPNLDELLPYYQGLINKYFPPVMKW